ncbi:hypothetical protein ACWGTO_18205 [Mesorhizobium sp. PL10]
MTLHVTEYKKNVKIVQCSICMAAMPCKFFSAQLAHALKLLVGADRTHRRWHMAGFSSPLLAKFPDCMQMQSGFLLSLRQQPPSASLANA